MANIVTRNQPQGLAKVDYSNPLTKGLMAAYNAISHSSAQTDLVGLGGPIPGYGDTGTPDFKAFVSGIGHAPTAANQIYFTRNNGPVWLTTASQITLVWHGYFNSATSTDEQLLGITTNGPLTGNGYANPNTQSAYGIRLVGNNTVGSLWNSGNTQQNYPFTAGKHTVVATFNTAGNVTLYLDGVQINQNIFGSAVSFLNATQIYFGSPIGNGTVKSSLGLIFSRELSAAEVKSISLNPWQIFQAPPHRWQFPTSRPARRIPTTRPCRNQPQSTVTPQLNLGNRLNQGALAIVSGALPVNIVSGKQMTVAGAGVLQLATPNGVAFSFRKNHYRETEILPAISTQTAVEFWVGYPIDLQPLASVAEAGFVTGSANNAMGICLRQRTASNNWGSVISWSTLSDSGEVLTLNKFTVLVSVRDQTGTRLYHDGVLKSTTAGAPASWGATTFILGSFIEDLPYWSTSNDTLLAGRLINNWSDADVKSFSANPWQLFKEQS